MPLICIIVVDIYCYIYIYIYKILMVNIYTDWLTGWLAGWLPAWLTDWLTEWMNEWMNDLVTYLQRIWKLSYQFTYFQRIESSINSLLPNKGLKPRLTVYLMFLVLNSYSYLYISSDTNQFSFARPISC